MKKKPKINELWERLCSQCDTYKSVDNFYFNWNKYYKSECKYCNQLKKKNRKIIAKNTWNEIHYSRDTWNRHSIRYNFRRRLLRIVWYLDGKWRVVSNITEKQIFRQKVYEKKYSNKNYHRIKHWYNPIRIFKRKINLILNY